MSVLANIGIVIAVIVWFIVICAAMVTTFEAVMDGNRRLAVFVFVVTILIVAVPLGIVMAYDESENSGLCLEGHQEWRHSSRPPALVGKVMVPGGSSSRKVWVCDKWEATEGLR